MTEVPLTGLAISHDDLLNFHAAHFSSISVNHFTDELLGTVGEEGCVGEEEQGDDGLGYYEDGAKRTLTDEQIAIFRHSEIEALLRERRHAQEAEEDVYESPVFDNDEPVLSQSTPVQQKDDQLLTEEEGLEDGEVDDDLSTPQASAPQQSHPNKKKNKRNKNKGANKSDRLPQPKGFFRQNVKPDLRKRTWDKVETGLENLDYDEDTSASSVPNPAAQRRRISYDDD